MTKIYNEKPSKKWKYCVYAQYSYAQYERGEVISRHKSYEAANKAAKGNSFAAISPITEII